MMKDLALSYKRFSNFQNNYEYISSYIHQRTAEGGMIYTAVSITDMAKPGARLPEVHCDAVTCDIEICTQNQRRRTMPN